MGDLNPTTGWPTSTCQRVSWVPDDDRVWRRYGTTQLDAVIPPEIANLSFAVPADVVGAAVEADAALQRLDAELAGFNPNVLDAAAAHLIRAESISSSRIEGLDLSARRLAEADWDPGSAKRLAREVTANVHAMRAALALGTEREPLTDHDLRDLHAILMADVPGINGGRYRDRQNWIGATNNPADATYVPPPPEHVERLVADVAAFVNRRDLSPTLQAAIAHAQFEGIHPFVDGNGRIGRCLIGVIVRKRTGAIVFPPVSAGIRRDVPGYFADLHAYQQQADPWPWARRFARVTYEACETARHVVGEIERLQLAWHERAGRPRRGSITARIIDVLPTLTITDVDQLVDRFGVDASTARRGLAALEAASVLRQVTAGRRNRVWRADEMHDVLDII